MDGAAIDGERGFLDRLVQRRMSVAGARDILEDAPKPSPCAFMDDRAGFMADDVDPKDTVGLGIGENLHEAVGMALRPRAAVRRKRSFLAIGDPGLLQRFLALASVATSAPYRQSGNQP